MRPWAVLIWFVPFVLDRFDAFVRAHAVHLNPWQCMPPRRMLVLWGTFARYAPTPEVRFIDISTPFIEWVHFFNEDAMGFGRRHYMWRSDCGWREWHERIHGDDA